MPSSDPDRRFADILGNAAAVAEYVSGMTFEQFVADRKTIDAVERCLLRASEAAIKLGAKAEAAAPMHNWAGLRGIGNVLRHEYDSIDPRINWRVATAELPELTAELARGAGKRP